MKTWKGGRKKWKGKETGEAKKWRGKVRDNKENLIS